MSASNPHWPATPAARPEPAAEAPGLIEQILEKAQSSRDGRDAARRQEIEEALLELALQVDSGRIPGYLVGNLPEMIAWALTEVDQELSGQLDLILHDEKYQRLEASWRNLYKLVQQAEGSSATGDEIQIKVLDARRDELDRDLKVGTPTSPINSAMAEKVHRNAFNTYGAIPYAALIGDFEFGYDPRDVDFLKKMSAVGAVAHAPFIAAAGAAMFDWSDFTEMASSGNLEAKFNQPQYDGWRAFRRRLDARYVGLCLPRILTRLPYGQGGEPVEAFRYREGVDGRDHSRYLWGNAAYAFAGRLVDAFAKDGWCMAISGPRGGGLVDDLPLHTFQTDRGEIAVKCPTEVQISADRDFALSKLGFIPLVHRMGESYAVFNGAPSAHLPDRYTNDDANANAFLAAQLPYLMAASRVAHYLKIIATEDIGSMTTAADYQYKLQDWINNYVIDQDSITEEQKRRKPLRKALIQVNEIAGRPGFYAAQAFITPHIKLEGLAVTVSLVANLPGGGKQGA